MSLVTTDILHIWRQQPAREPDQIFFDFDMKLTFFIFLEEPTNQVDTYGTIMHKTVDVNSACRFELERLTRRSIIGSDGMMTN